MFRDFEFDVSFSFLQKNRIFFVQEVADHLKNHKSKILLLQRKDSIGLGQRFKKAPFWRIWQAVKAMRYFYFS